MSSENVQEYAIALTKLFAKCFSKGKNLSAEWCDEYNKQERTIEESLALAHPDFWFGMPLTRAERTKRHPIRPYSGFSNIKNQKKCATEDCPFSKLLPLFEAGHIWPDSLGGPAILLNAECQCFTCNRMASFSIDKIPWDEWGRTEPRWLGEMLETLKLRHERRSSED